MLKKQIDQLIEEAKTFDFKSVCVNPIWVKYAKHKLKKTDVLVCTVIGFPHGTHHADVKAFEAQRAILDGADELDMVINVHALKSRITIQLSRKSKVLSNKHKAKRLKLL
jgi:deoxyribose-phosphate aldolase